MLPPYISEFLQCL